MCFFHFKRKDFLFDLIDTVFPFFNDCFQIDGFKKRARAFTHARSQTHMYIQTQARNRTVVGQPAAPAFTEGTQGPVGTGATRQAATPRRLHG